MEGQQVDPVILKYPFRYMDNAPLLRSGQQKKTLLVEVSRMMEIQAGKVPKPQKQHTCQKDEPFQLDIDLDFGGDITKFQFMVSQLLEKYKKKTSFHYEEDLRGDLNELFQAYSRQVFDKTRIKSLNEVSLLQGADASREFQVK